MDNPFYFLLFGLLVAWVGSYFYNIIHNRRKLRQLALWLQPALNLLGGKTTSRWFGTDRLDINVEQGRGSVREAAFVLGFQSRQLFKLLKSVLRGGRDSLSLLISLHNKPDAETEFEIYLATTPIPQNVVLATGTEQAWEIAEHSKHQNYNLAFRNQKAHESASRILTLLLDDGFEVRRLSVRTGIPHVFLVLNLGSMPQVEATTLLRSIKNLCDEVSTTTVATKLTSKIKLNGRANRLN